MVKDDRPDLPVSVISAYGVEDTITVAVELERGANKFPTKPVDLLGGEDVLAERRNDRIEQQ